MTRNIFAALGGYIGMVLVAVAGIGIAWFILGAAGAFAGDSPTPSTAWIIGNLVGGFVAAVTGGWLARRLGTASTSVNILIGFVLVLGLATALLSQGMVAEPLGKPVAELTFMEAGQFAVQPAWYNWTIPLVGAAGVWIGGRRSAGRS